MTDKFQAGSRKRDMCRLCSYTEMYVCVILCASLFRFPIHLRLLLPDKLIYEAHVEKYNLLVMDTKVHCASAKMRYSDATLANTPFE